MLPAGLTAAEVDGEAQGARGAGLANGGHRGEYLREAAALADAEYPIDRRVLVQQALQVGDRLRQIWELAPAVRLRVVVEGPGRNGIRTCDPQQAAAF